MVHSLILFIYCTKEDGLSVRHEATAIPNIYLQITASKNRLSIKGIVAKLQKAHQLRQDDYVIAIDNHECINFHDDTCADNVLHFTSLSRFYDWFREKFK